MGTDRHEGPPKASKGRKKASFETTWIQFSPEDKSTLRERFKEDGEQLLEQVFDILESGWKLGISYSDHYGGFVGSLTCKDADHSHHKMVLLTTNSDRLKLLYSLVYVREVIVESGRLLDGKRVFTDDW